MYPSLVDFNPVDYLYLNPDLKNAGIDTVEDAYSHFMVNSNLNLLHTIDLPDNFSWRVYYCSATDDIRTNTSYLDSDMVDNLLNSNDLERLSVIHYMNVGSNIPDKCYYPYKIKSDFNELLYRTFEKNTTLATEEDLFIKYEKQKKNTSNFVTSEAPIIGTKQDLLLELGKNLQLGLDLTVDNLCVRDFLSITPAPDSCKYVEKLNDTLASSSSLFQLPQGVTGPGFVLATDTNVFTNPTYFTSEVYFGSNIVGVKPVIHGDVSMDGITSFGSNVDVSGSIFVNGSISAQSIRSDTYEVGELIVTSNVVFRCDGAHDSAHSAEVTNVIEEGNESFVSFEDGLRVPGAYFSSNLNVITNRTVFTSEVVFCNGLVSMQCCEGSGSGSGSGSGGTAYPDLTGNVNVGSNLCIEGNTKINGSLEVGGDFRIKIDGNCTSNSNDAVRNAITNSESFMSIETSLNVPNVIFDQDITVFTGPIYFADDVIFGKSLMTDNCYHFDREVYYDSNLYVDGEIFAKSMRVDSLVLDSITFNTESNVSFSKNVTVDDSLTVKGSTDFRSNVDIEGTLVVTELVLTGNVRFPVKPIDIQTSTQLYAEIFTQDTSTTALFDNGLSSVGAALGPSGSVFSQPVYFKNDVFFGAEIYKDDISKFSSNIQVCGDGQFLSNVNIAGTAVIEGMTVVGSNLTVEGVVDAFDYTKHSDRRIKHMIRDVDDVTVFSFVDSVYVKAYKMKGGGEKTHYGVIAQEIEILNDNIVTKSHRFIPNVCRDCKVYSDGVVFLSNNDIELGDMLKFVCDGKDVITDVIQIISSNSFRVRDSTIHMYEMCALYGKEVEDFRSVDVSQIVAILLHSVKDLRARVAMLEAH
jgi:predicted acyltransferase (DUF342 family)